MTVTEGPLQSVRKDMGLAWRTPGRDWKNSTENKGASRSLLRGTTDS